MKRLKVVSLALFLALPVTAALVEPPVLQAQADAMRNLTGDVTNKAGNKVKGAVVHLKDTRSLAQRSYITAEDGVFRFGQLSSTADYEVWADLNGKKTPSKTISSFDSKKAVDLSLKLPD
ncbi:MAG: carboxypeptidase-like regulatory domain-containing protein [Janthinobacterium lividum]